MGTTAADRVRRKAAVLAKKHFELTELCVLLGYLFRCDGQPPQVLEPRRCRVPKGGAA